MALNLERLFSIARGEITPESGVTGVAHVADVARYASKSPELRQLRPLRVKNTELEKDSFMGVVSGVTASDALPSQTEATPPKAPARDPAALQLEADRRNRESIKNGWTDAWCACGTMATLAVGYFDTSKRVPARWVCDGCFDQLEVVSK